MSGALDSTYMLHALQTVLLPGREGRVSWECPANIAIIKYWGKKSGQLPLNPSLSFTLAKSVTRLSVDYDVNPDYSTVLDFRFEGKPRPEFRQKVLKYLQVVRNFFPYLKHAHLAISSANSFPHSAGIASSASSYGALALALCSMEQQLQGNEIRDAGFFQKASFIARLGSGSACRSVFGGAVLWGRTDILDSSSDETAIPVTSEMHRSFKDFRDSILIVNSGPKTVSSTTGHELMNDHPYAGARIIQANRNLERMLDILRAGDLGGFTDILENEALSLHALMLSSNPGYILWHSNTIEIINRIRSFRLDTGFPVGFTMDAGANIHVLYPGTYDGKIREFIEAQLRKYCENGRVIQDEVGEGPREI